MQDYIVYAVEREQLSGIKHPEVVIFCELWKKLPPLDFDKTKSRGGDEALRAENAAGYVWIPPSTAAALPSSRLLKALGYRSNRRIYFFSVELQPNGVDFMSLLADAKAFNIAQIAEAKKLERKKEEALRKKK
jgi:hypothetical protein